MAPRARLRLSEIQEGDNFNILSVNPISGEFLGYLEGMGIGIRTSGRLMAKDPFIIQINGPGNETVHVIGRDTADHIFVELS